MPEVTVAVPVHNGAQHLDQALESLSRQTFADVSFVIADNCSSDCTWDIVQAWAAKDPRFLIHQHAQNLGAAGNFAWLLEHASSPYFMFAAHDDWRSDNYIEALYRAITADPRFKLAAPMVVKTNPDGTEALRTRYCGLDNATRIGRVRRGLRWSQAGWFYGMFRTDSFRDALDRTKTFPTPWGADYLTLLPFILADSVTGTNDAVFFQRQTGLSETTYKPATLEAQTAFTAAFMHACYETLGQAPLTPAEKAAAALMLIPFTNTKAWKFRRLLRSAIMRPFRKKPA